LYGGEEPVHFSVDERSLKNLIYTPEVFLVQLDVNGSNYQAVMGEIQFHPVTDRVTHIDFILVVAEKPVQIGMPLRMVGNSPGVRAGGKLRQNFRKLMVSGLVADLPEFIEVDISSLKIGDAVRVGSLSVDGLTFLDAASSVVVAVKTSRKAAATDEEEEEEGGEEGAEAPAEAEASES
ncbi:MAG: 50S ribosomal protein L25, partial [Bacteroidota bacterium]